jgi:hypothetical protein
VRFVTRLAVMALVCLAFAGFFGAKVLAGSQLGGIGLPTVTLSTPVTTQTVTVPTVTTVTTPTTVTVPTATVTAPTGTTVTSPAATVPVTAPSTTVAVTTSVATVTATTPVPTLPVTTSAPTVATSTTTSMTTGTLPVAVAETDPTAASTATAQEPRARPRAGTGATGSGLLGAPDGGSVAATRVLKDPSRAGETSAVVILSPGRGQPTVLLKRFRVQRLPGPARRFAVQLRFLLSGPARVRFFVFGPAPGCSLAGRFTIAGHAGLNKLPFRGRIRGRLLRAGIYTIVPQTIARVGRPPGPRVAIMIDARGVHLAAPAPWENCRSATRSELLVSVAPVLPIAPRFGGVAGAIATEPATPADTQATRADRSVDTSREFKAWILPSAGRNWLTVAVLMSLLASVTLLGLAAVEPLYARMRFPLVRAIDAHRGQVAFSGATLLAAAGVLLLVGRLM